jgi:hypothetical protein
VAKATQLAIRDVVLDAFNRGGHPYEQARRIRAVLSPPQQANRILSRLGLTQTQAQAVDNYEAMLLGGDVSELRTAAQRALRDRRFDANVFRAILQKKPVPQAKAAQMVERYYERMLQYRARNIARTETIRAAHAGQEELWRQATEQGLLKPERTRRKWIVTPDDRLCPICRAIPGRNLRGVPLGVPLGEAFNTPIGGVKHPPAHPSCRCTLGLMFLPRRKAA